ncbi:MAG: hypothetical protein IJ220_03905 [Clostridia bacterium]|nr:hypothetical protein [Clostridia bacterium]
MMSDMETLKILERGNFESLYANYSIESGCIIKNRIQDIPSEYFEPRIDIDKESNTKISLIQFSLQTAEMNAEQRNGLMERYSIDPYDVQKLQTIIDSIKIAQEMGSTEQNKENRGKVAYGFSLASEDRLSRAYILLLAYQYADSTNPLRDIQLRLKADGMDEKYNAKTIVEVIEHTNMLMVGKTAQEKKAFYMQSISGILEDSSQMIDKNEKIDVEI